ncbi:unnamed protein product [Rhizoctonia solani]|uniref:Uncharacterized protein n=1 Tax=Rhizoctonia solani TaxID=456999 RepID=A0A8H3D2Q3_9AGAM|nr:unnamed protein product [Rhizoctonia solani]
MASSWLICTWLYIVTLGMVHALTTQVDDSEIYESTRPNGIQYPSTQPGGDWARLFPPDSDGRYQSTILFTGTVGALAVYFFKGTSIGYYSDMSPQLENMLVTLDGRNSSSINTEGASAYQKLLWSESNLDDGDHQLIVSLGLGSDSEFTASLDYLEVTHTGDITPSKLGPGARDSHSGVIIDNKDPQINYKGEWSSRRSNPPRSHYYSGSQHSTKQLGDSLTFNFTGTAIYYFAEKKPSNGRVSISIDGGAGDTVDTSLPASDDNPPQFSQVLCWSQTGLSDRPHTVKITHMGDSGMDVSLDFFKYTPSQKGGSQSTPLAAIIGGSVGGGLFLIIGPPERVDNDTKDSEKLASQSIVETTVPYKGHQQEPTNKPMSEVSVSSAGPASSRARMTPQLYHGLPEPHTA